MPTTVQLDSFPWGPGAAINSVLGNTASASLNNATNSAATVFKVPPLSPGVTLTHIGVNVTTRNGTPPAYNVALVTLSSGNPSATPYGGSAVLSATFGATGFVWLALGTPATPVTGDLIAARIWPGVTPPDGSNNVYVTSSWPFNGAYLRDVCGRSYVGGWMTLSGYAFAVKASDGTVILPSISTMLTANINTGTTPDEIGCLLQIPFDCKCIGAFGSAYIPSTNNDFQLRLYNAASTLLASGTIDVSEEATGGWFSFGARWAAQSLTANTDYRVSVLPTSANSIQLHDVTLAEAASRYCWAEGRRWQHTQRTDAGAWAETPTRLPMMGLLLSEMTLPTAGGGGIVTTTVVHREAAQVPARIPLLG